MRLPALLLFGLAAAASSAASSWGAAQDRWAEADAATVRLPPAAFSRLPRGVVRHLQRRGCTIPQTFTGGEPHNVIRGQFARRGQTDWAVLCSRRGRSSVLVFWNGSAVSVGELADDADKDFLQTVDGAGTIGFSRSIRTVGRAYILAHSKEYGGPRPPRITHDGINDAYLGKASSVHYYHRGRWLEMQGAD